MGIRDFNEIKVRQTKNCTINVTAYLGQTSRRHQSGSLEQQLNH